MKNKGKQRLSLQVRIMSWFIFYDVFMYVSTRHQVAVTESSGHGLEAAFMYFVVGMLVSVYPFFRPTHAGASGTGLMS